MTAIVKVKYTGSALPGNAETVVLFSTASIPVGNWGAMSSLHSFHYDIKNDQTGTINGYKRAAKGATRQQFYTQAVAIPAAGLTSNDVVLIEGFSEFEFEWVNGATPQGTFDVDMDLSTFP